MEVTLELQLQISLSSNEGFPTSSFYEKFLMLPSSFVNHSKSDRHKKTATGKVFSSPKIINKCYRF